MASTGLFPQPLWISVRSACEPIERMAGAAALSMSGSGLGIRIRSDEMATGNWKLTTITTAVLPVWSFLAVTLPLVLTPGASTAVVLRNSISGGTRAGVETAAGVNSGSIAYGVLSAFGMAVALRRWPAIWVVLRYAGAGYLAWLAVRSLAAAVAPRPQPVVTAAAPVRRGPLNNIAEGFFTNFLNPAIATFYLVVVPQFVPAGAPVARSVLLLMIVHVAIALSWHLVWAAAGATLARWLSAGPARRALDAATAVALLVLAGRVLMTSR